MEITKKQFILYTVILLVLGSTASLVAGEKPEEMLPLWERLWQVDQPVSIDDNDASITVDTNEGALEVATPKGESILIFSGTIDPYDLVVAAGGGVDVSGYSKVYVYVQAIEEEEIDDLEVRCKWYLQPEGGPEYNEDHIDMEIEGDKFVNWQEITVRGNKLYFDIYNPFNFVNQVEILLYGVPN